jgi:hypothetical protein
LYCEGFHPIQKIECHVSEFTGFLPFFICDVLEERLLKTG